MQPTDPNDIKSSSSSESDDQSERSSQSSQEDRSLPSDHPEPSDHSSREDRSSSEDQSDRSFSSSQSDQSSQSSRKQRAERGAYDALIITILTKVFDRNEKISDNDLCERINRKLPVGKTPITVQQLRAIKMRLKKSNKLPMSAKKERSDQSSRAEVSDQSFRSDRSDQKEQSVRAESSDVSSQMDHIAARFASFEDLPLTAKDGRKDVRDAEKRSVTLDRNLFKIIAVEAQKRRWKFGYTLEWFIWNLCGRPPLTYSPPESAQDSVAEPEPVEVKPERQKPGRKPKETKAEEPKEKKGKGGRRSKVKS